MKTEKEIIEWKRKYARQSFIGHTLEENKEIRQSLIKAVGVLHDMKYGYYLPSEDQKVLDTLEEILYPKSRHDPEYDGSRDPDGIGIDIGIGNNYERIYGVYG